MFDLVWFTGMRGERVLLRHQPRDPGRPAGGVVRREQEVLRAAAGGEDVAEEEQRPPGLHPALRREARRVVRIPGLNPVPDLPESTSVLNPSSINYGSGYVPGYQ